MLIPLKSKYQQDIEGARRLWMILHLAELAVREVHKCLACHYDASGIFIPRVQKGKLTCLSKSLVDDSLKLRRPDLGCP